MPSAQSRAAAAESPTLNKEDQTLNIKYRTLNILLPALLILTGCGKAAAPASDGNPAASGYVSGAGQETAVVVQAELADPAHGMLVHFERQNRDAMDPAEGKERILSYAWDSLRLESDSEPEAARLIAEDLAARQDRWYTGTGEAACDRYGYEAMLAAAEDQFTVARNYGSELIPCSASRTLTLLPSDGESLSFLVRVDTDLGAPENVRTCELLCYDLHTGAILNDSRGDEIELLEEAAKTRPAKEAAGKASVSIRPLNAVPEDRIEIVDRVVVGDGGEASLLLFSGTALDVEICTAVFTDRFYPDRQIFACPELSDCALQLALLFPGDLPDTMLRYRDSEGEHELLIGLSGRDGSIILTENTFTLQG